MGVIQGSIVMIHTREKIGFRLKYIIIKKMKQQHLALQGVFNTITFSRDILRSKKFGIYLKTFQEICSMLKGNPTLLAQKVWFSIFVKNASTLRLRFHQRTSDTHSFEGPVKGPGARPFIIICPFILFQYAYIITYTLQ